MFFSYISSRNHVKNILYSTFRHLSFLSIILYISTFQKIFVLFLQYGGEIYKFTTNTLGKKVSV